jgi:hypothetical protein
MTKEWHIRILVGFMGCPIQVDRIISRASEGQAKKPTWSIVKVADIRIEKVTLPQPLDQRSCSAEEGVPDVPLASCPGSSASRTRLPLGRWIPALRWPFSL